MANYLSGNDQNSVDLQDLLDIFRPKQDDVQGKGFIIEKAVYKVAGGNTDNSGIVIECATNTSVWGGFVRVEGIGDDTGSLDFDIGLTAGAADFGAAYGDRGDGVYALKLNDYVDVATPEEVHISFDGNSISNNKTITITVCMLMAVAPATS